jgi:hypothetical protein
VRGDGGWSLVVRAGLPTPSLVDVGFLRPPELEAPSGAGPHVWDARLAWSVRDEDASKVEVELVAGGVTIGVGLVTARDRSFAWPALPSDSSYLAPAALETIVRVVERDDATGLPSRLAYEAPLPTASPLGP